MDYGFVTALAVLTLAAISADAAPPDGFIVSFWCAPPAEQTTQARYQEIAAAGFNVVMPPCGPVSVETNKRILDLCLDNGMKAIISDPRIMAKQAEDPDFSRNLDAVIADYSAHPALYGYFLTDEPNSAAFPHIAAVNKYLLEKDPKHLPFVNLFPTYASAEQLGNPTYEEHVEQFLSTVQPKLLSYDHYQQMTDYEGAGYFTNLEIIRRRAIRHGVPFNNIILSCPHGPYRNPSEADMRWQVYTTLAYGARGVMYFTYWTPSDEQWGFRNAIIGLDGRKTEHYDQVSTLNRDILTLGRVLSRCRSDAVYHVGKVPPEAAAMPEDGILTGIEGGDAVVGFFTSEDGRRYVMVVNKDMREGRRLRLVFRQPVTLYRISPLSGLPRRLGRETSYRFRFAAGEGRLFEFREEPEPGHARPRVMLNPSAQYGNVIRAEDGTEIYNEGETLWDIAVKVKEELDRDGRVDAYLSRKGRRERSFLYQECDLAKMIGCDVFVSLHSDATGTDDPGGGTWTFYKDEEGRRLAGIIQNHLIRAIRTVYPEVQDRGIREHWYRLYVLWYSGCPASLTEILFHTNPKEREMLKDPEFQRLVARAVAQGVLEYLGLEKPAS